MHGKRFFCYCLMSTYYAKSKIVEIIKKIEKYIRFDLTIIVIIINDRYTHYSFKNYKTLTGWQDGVQYYEITIENHNNFFFFIIIVMYCKLNIVIWYKFYKLLITLHTLLNCIY